MNIKSSKCGNLLDVFSAVDLLRDGCEIVTRALGSLGDSREVGVHDILPLAILVELYHVVPWFEAAALRKGAEWSKLPIYRRGLGDISPIRQSYALHLQIQ